MAYISGTHVEDRLIVRLQKLGCDLTQSEELNHKYKLDFLVTQFQGIAKMKPIGVQVTTRPGDREKMREFLDRQKAYAYVDKALYLELHTSEIEQGVDRLVYSSMITFIFSTTYTGTPYIGLKIKPNFTIEFFDLEAEIARLGQQAVAPVAAVGPEAGEPQQPVVGVGQTDPAVGAELRGFVRSIRKQGFGFIDAEPDGFTFFYPISKVEDDELRKELAEHQQAGTQELRIPVRFVNLGRVREGKHPMAGKIVRGS